MSKDEKLRMFGVINLMQNGAADCHLDTFLSRDGKGKSPALFVEYILGRGYPGSKEEKLQDVIMIENLFNHKGWDFDVAFFETRGLQLTCEQVEGSSYFHSLSQGHGFGQYSYYMDSTLAAQAPSSVQSKPTYPIYEWVEIANSQFIAPPHQSKRKDCLLEGAPLE